MRQLEPEYLVGRAPACALRISHRFVSARHAILRWTGEQWDLKDLGSRNGTFLDGHKVTPGEDHIARQGAKIAFGKREEEWELIDDAPPRVMAVPIGGGEPVVGESELLALPSSDEPLVTVYPSPEGGWLIEYPNEAIT
ncbi:MAG TPA: FHA domain-containing protein, partial [Polyangiaceae bacterium]